MGSILSIEVPGACDARASTGCLGVDMLLSCQGSAVVCIGANVRNKYHISTIVPHYGSVYIHWKFSI